MNLLEVPSTMVLNTEEMLRSYDTFSNSHPLLISSDKVALGMSYADGNAWAYDMMIVQLISR